MNVLCATTLYPGPRGGREGNFIHYQNRALAAAGCRLTVLLMRPWIGRVRADGEAVPYRYQVDGIQVFAPRCPALPRYLLWPHAGLMRFLRVRRLAARLHRREPFDLVHGHGLVAGDVARRVSRRLGIPSVTSIHGVEEAAAATWPRRRALRRILEGADRVVAVGRPLLPWIGEFAPDARVATVPNGVDPAMRCERIPDELAREKADRIVILGVGRLDTAKGFEETLEALAALPGRLRERMVYWVVGDGHRRAHLEELAGQLGVESRVVFWGEVGHGGIGSFYAACDIFCLPSWMEAFGLPYLEAMLHGKPVVGCRGQGAEEMAIHQETGFLVTPRNVTQLSAALGALLSDPGAREAMGARGRERALSLFTWERSASRLREVYEEVMVADRGEKP